MRKIKIGLFVKVLIAIVCGALLGLVAPDPLVRILKTFNVLFAQLLKFIIPLLILGLVTPAIANVGKNAGKMLLIVIGIAYLSTICSGFFAHVCSSNVFPLYLKAGEIVSEREGRRMGCLCKGCFKCAFHELNAFLSGLERGIREQ